MKTSADLRTKTIDELNTELEALQKEIFNLRIQKGLGEAPKSNSIKEVRHKIARIKTIINEKARAS